MPPVVVVEAVLAQGLAHPSQLAAMVQVDLSFTPTTRMRSRAAAVVVGRPLKAVLPALVGTVAAGAAVELVLA